MNPHIPPEAIERLHNGVQMRPNVLDPDFAIDIRHAQSDQSLFLQVHTWSHRFIWTAFAVDGGVPYDIACEHIATAPAQLSQHIAVSLIGDWQSMRKNGHIPRPEEPTPSQQFC